jgi:hypothetical protein
LNEDNQALSAAMKIDRGAIIEMGLKFDLFPMGRKNKKNYTINYRYVDRPVTLGMITK